MTDRSQRRADPLIARRPALAAMELATIARGVVVLDGMAKRAETTIVAARTLSPGRYLIVLSGEVAEIEEAVGAGAERAEEDLVDRIILRDPHSALLAGLENRLSPRLGESLAIVETTSVSSALAAIDRALKDADVELVELRLGAGLSGKGVFTLTGALHMIGAARAAIGEAIRPERLVRVEVIARPHPDLPRHLLGAEPGDIRGGRPED